MVRKLLLNVLLLLPLLGAESALAQWTLNNDMSQLSFVTVKADHVAEVHTFDRLTGEVDASGNVLVAIELASVNTLIPIRDERMQALLFETELFPRAEISTTVDIADLRAMTVGESKTRELAITLDMHGLNATYNADVLVTRTEDGVVATSLKPIIVNAQTHNLVRGVEALREVVGLPSISQAVPVSFTVVFE